MISASSRMAYKDHQKSGGVGRQASLLLMFILYNQKRDGWSRSELSESTGVKVSSVCARVNELMARGKLAALPMRKCRVTGKTIIPVVAA